MAQRKPKTKQEFIERESLAWLDLNELVTDLPDECWTQPGAAGDWSLKDVWAHIADWMKETRRVMPILIRGEPVSAHIQTFNAEHDARNRNLSLDAARKRVERERKQLLKLFRSMSEEDLLGNRRCYTWASYATYNHYAEHIPGLTCFRRAMRRGKFKSKSQ